MVRGSLYLAGASAAAIVLACPAAAQTVPEPGGTPPTGTIETGAGADPDKSGDAQSGTTQSAEPRQSATGERADGDIIVTAQRRSETLQQVPIAVSAFTGQALERQQISNATDLQLSLPNVTFTKTNFTSSSFTIRGIGDLCTGFSCDQATGIHVNDMPLTSTRLFETEYFDLERVEVLRGPQGTLFGRNATSGVVNFITARPDLSKVAMSGTLEYGNYKSLKATGMVNVPITDTLGVRLAGYFLSRDGYTKNIFDNSRIDGRDLYALRGSIRWRPSPSTTLDIVGYRFHENDDRSRIQKQLCNNDPTGVLGCAPDRLEYETVNGRSTLAATLSSQQFIRARFLTAPAAFQGLVAGLNLGLVDLNSPTDAFYGGVVNPDDLRTVNIDFKPTYQARESFLMGRLEQDLTDRFSVTVTGGYQKQNVDSRTDYNLVAANSLLGNPGLTNLAIAAAAFPATFGPAYRALAPSGLGGPFCVSETNPLYSGIYGGQVNSCSDRGGDYDRSNSTSRQYSLEGHLDSNFDGPFNFLVGGIYLDNKFTNSNYYVASYGLDYASGVLGGLLATAGALGGAAVPPLFQAPPFYNSEVNSFRLKSYGLFGETYFQASERLKFTLGLRYSHDDKTQVARAPILSWAAPIGLTDATTSPFLTTGIPALGIAPYDADASVAGAQPFAIGNVKFGRFTGRAVADFKLTSNNLLYASASRGYKSGGLNPPIDPSFNVSPTFEPETIDAFEVGSKNTFAGGAIRLNLAGFFYNYKGLQLSRIVARTSVNDNTDASIYGGEAEAVFRPARDLLINLSASYLKSRIKDLSLVDPRDPSGGLSSAVIIKDLAGGANFVVTSPTLPTAAVNAFVGAINGAVLGLNGPVPIPGTNTTGAFSLVEALQSAISNPSAALRTAFGTPTGSLPFAISTGIEQDLSGNELPQAPNWKLSAGVQYTVRFGNGWTLVPRADWNWTGSFFARSFNRPIDKVDSFAVVNAQVQLNGPDDRWFARAFVQNATDNDAITGQFVADASSGLFTNVFTLEPRRYGVAFGVKF